MSEGTLNLKQANRDYLPLNENAESVFEMEL
jgi:hypothetical protein